MAFRPQPYRLQYNGSDPRLAKIVQDIDEMFFILFGDLGGTEGDNGVVQISDPFLTALTELGGTGFLVKTGDSSAVVRSLVAGTNISITNTDGVAGDPTISFVGTAGVSQAQIAARIAHTI